MQDKVALKQRDEYTDRLIKKRNAIEIELYTLLIHPDHMKKNI